MNSGSSQADKQRWIIAVDGGGSKIAIAGREWYQANNKRDSNRDEPAEFVRSNLTQLNMRVWHFEGTGSAHPSTWSQAADNLVSAIHAVVEQLSEESAELGMVKLALAGAGRPDDQARVIDMLRTRCDFLSGVPIQCMGDIDPLVDYKDAHRCIAVILGTGSVVASRNDAGEMVRAGGWGPLLGDACSGGAIGLSALRYLTHLLDEGQTTEQLSHLAKALVAEVRSLRSHDEASLNSLLIQTASDRAQTAKLSGIVLDRAYRHADRTAMEMIEPHLADLVWQIRQVARRAGINEEVLQLNFTGGIAEHHPPLRQAIVQACLAAGLNVTIEHMVDPLQALLG